MLKSAPVPFILAVFVGIVFTTLYYGREISGLGQQIEILKQINSDYQERLGIVPRDYTAFSKLTNKELKARADQYIRKLRVFDAKRTSDQSAIMAIEDGRTRSRMIDEWIQRYQSQFQPMVGEGRALRDEMLSRIPEDRRPVLKPPFSLSALDTGSLAGWKPVGDIISFLQQVVEMLP